MWLGQQQHLLVDEPPVSTGARLRAFTLFNPTIAPEEDAAGYNVLYFYPHHTPLDSQLMLVGLCAAMNAFPNVFGTGDVRCIGTKLSRRIIVRLEGNFWAVAHVELGQPAPSSSLFGGGGGGGSPTTPNAQSDSFPGGDAARRTAASGGGWKKKTEYAFSAYDDENEFDFEDGATSSDDDDRNVFAGFGDDDDDAGDALERQQLLRDKDRRRKERQRRKLAASRSFSGKRTADEAKYANPAAIAGRDVDIECGITDAVRRIILSHYARFVLENGSLAFTFGRALEAEEAILPPLASTKPKESMSSSSIAGASTSSADAVKGLSEQKTPQRSKHELRQVRRRAAGRVKILFGGTGDTIVEDCTTAVQSPAGSMGVQDHLAFHGVDSAAFLAAGCAVSRLHNGLPNALQHTVVATGDGRVAATTLDHPATVALLGLASKHKWKPDGTWSFMENATAEDIDTVRALSQAGLGAGGLAYDQVRPSPAPSMPRPPSHHRTHGPSSQRHGPGYTSSKAPPNSTNANRGGDQDGQGGRGSDGPTAVSPSPFRSIIDRLNPFSRREQSMPASAATAPTSAFPGAVLPPAAVAAAANPDIGRAAPMPTVASPTRLGGTASGSRIGDHDSPSRRNPPNATNRPGGGGSVSRSGIDGSSSGVLHHHTQGPATKRSAAAFAGKEPAPPAPEAAAAAAAAAAASNANTNAAPSASASAHTPSEAAVGSGLTGTSDESRTRGEGESENTARDRSPEPKPVGPIVSGMGGVSASRLARHEVEECATHGKAVLVPLRQPPPKAPLPTPVPESQHERIAAASDVQPDDHGSASSSAVVTSAPPHTTAAPLVSLNRGSMRRSVPRTLPAADGLNTGGDGRGGGGGDGGGGDDGPGAVTMPQQQRASSSSCPAAAPQTIPFYSMQSVETAEKVWFTSTPVARVFVGDMEQALFSFHVGGFVVFCLVPNNYTKMKELQDGVVSSIACALSAESQGLRRVGQAAARGDKASGKLDEAVVYTYANAAISARKTSVQPYTSYSGKAPARDFFENALLLDNMRYGSLVCPPGAATVDADGLDDEEDIANAEGACGGGEVDWSGSAPASKTTDNPTRRSSIDPAKPSAVSMPSLEGTTAAANDDAPNAGTGSGERACPPLPLAEETPKAVGLSVPLENLRRRREEEAAMFAEQVAALDRIEGVDASTSQRPLRVDAGVVGAQQQSSSSGDPNASSLKSPDESERSAFFPESSSNAHRVNGTPMEPRSQLSPPSAASASGQASSRQSPTTLSHTDRGTQRAVDGSHHARVTSTAERSGDRGGDVDVFGPYQQSSTTTSRSKLQTHGGYGGHGGYGTKQHGDDETWSPAGSVSSLYAPRDDFGDGGQGASPGGAGGPGGANDGMSLHEVQRESVAAAAATANRLSLSFAGIQLAAVVAANAGTGSVGVAGAANGAAGRRSLRLHERASMRGGGGHQHGCSDSPMKNNRGTGSLSGSGHSSTGGGGGGGGQAARTTQHGFAAGAKFLASAGQASVAASHTTSSARPRQIPQHGGSTVSIPGHGLSTTSTTTGTPGGTDRPTLKSQPSMSALSTTSTAAYDPVAPSQNQQRMRKASQDSTSVLSMSQDSSLCITGSLRIQETASFATDPYRSPLRGAGVGGRKSVDGSASGAMGLAATSVTSTASTSAGPSSGQLRRQSSSLTQQQQQIIREQLEATRITSTPTSAGVVPTGGGQQPSTSLDSADKNKSIGPGKPAVDTSVAAEDIAARDKPQRPVPAFHPSVGSLIRADGRGINGSMTKPLAASTGSRSTTPTTTTPTTTTPTTTTPTTTTPTTTTPRTSAPESKKQGIETTVETVNDDTSNHPKSVLVPRPRHQRQNYFDIDAVSERRENAKTLGPLSSRMEIMNAHFANPAEVEESGTRAVAPLSSIIPKGVTIPKQSSNKPSEISHRITSQGKYVASSRRTLPSATPVFPFDDSTVSDPRSDDLGADLECEGCGAHRAGCLALLPDPEASVLAALGTTRSPNTDKTTVMHIVRLRQDAWGFVVRGAYREFSFVVTKQVTLKKALHEAARIRGFALVGVNMD